MPLYFAYGSNLSSERLRQPDRAPSARVVGTATLSGHLLAWHKRGADGSGKCTLCPTGRRADGVWGVVWEIAEDDVARLDAVEGPGYERIELVVTSANQKMNVFSYLARESHVDSSLRPQGWYRALVVAGAREHGLPASWIRNLEAGPDDRRAETSCAPTPPDDER